MTKKLIKSPGPEERPNLKLVTGDGDEVDSSLPEDDAVQILDLDDCGASQRGKELLSEFERSIGGSIVYPTMVSVLAGLAKNTHQAVIDGAELADSNWIKADCDLAFDYAAGIKTTLEERFRSWQKNRVK